MFDAGVEDYFVIDIRKQDKYTTGLVDFEEGHLPGAHSVALADVVTYEAEHNTEGLPVLVVCYTGQEAAHAVAALRLRQVEAYSLKWGMSGWHSAFDLWTANLGDASNDYAGAWSTDAPPTLGAFEAPTLATGFEDGADILQARLDAAVLDGFNKITIPEVLADPDDYFVVNYWEQTHWDTYGHVTGAYRIGPGELTLDTLAALDPGETIVVYCWTGQNSSLVTAWLQVLGYDARSLMFGANGLVYSDLTSFKFPGALDFAYETGAGD